MTAARITAVLGAILFLAGCGPWERTPGFRLFGEVVADPVEDWEFTDAHPTIALESRPPWLIPHSVTVVCFRYEGDLYVPSRSPEGKRWVSNVRANPEVRLKIGDRIYERRAEPVDDAERVAALHEAIGQKYERMRSPEAELIFFRMAPR